MRFFPHVVKQPLLGTEPKRKRKEKGSLSNDQISKKPVHIGLKIFFIVGQRKVSTGRQLQSSRTGVLVLIDFSFGPLT